VMKGYFIGFIATEFGWNLMKVMRRNIR